MFVCFTASSDDSLHVSVAMAASSFPLYSKVLVESVAQSLLQVSGDSAAV